MRIITGHDRPRDGTSIFELTHKDEIVFYGDARAIANYLGVTPSAVKHDRKVIDHHTRVIGQIEYVYYYRGKVGTREALAQELDIRKGRESQLITSVFIHDDTVYLNGMEVYLMHLDKYMNSLNKRKGIKNSKVVKTPRIVYKGENKRYVDSLFNNCFKGWRA